MTYGFSIDHMPNCKIMSQCYASSDLSAMTNCLNGVTHGPVHVLIGGAWGQGSTFDDGDINFVRNINKVLYFKVSTAIRLSCLALPLPHVLDWLFMRCVDAP